MGACGSLCDCLQSRPCKSPREPIPNPFLRDDLGQEPRVYTILGKHPNGLTYGDDRKAASLRK